MKKLLCTLLITLFSFSLLLAQWVSENYGNHRLRAVQYFESGDGFICGEDGFIIKLSNFGKNFDSLKNLPSSPPSLRDLYFINQNTGWVVGAAGAIFRTLDGGLIWKNQSQGSYIYNACHFLFQNPIIYGWVSGNNIVYFTNDKGEHWQRQDDGIQGTVYDIYFSSLQKGFCITSKGIFYKNSTDPWKRMYDDTTIIYKSFSQSSASVGWVVGQKGTILRSASLPNNWQKIIISNFAINLNSVFALSDDEAYAVGDGGTVVHLTNAGKESEVFNLDENFFEEVFALDQDNIWIVGNNGANYYSEGFIKFGKDSIKANEKIEADTKRTIPFEATFNSTVDLFYSLNNGINSTLLERGYNSDLGQYAWTTPDTSSKTCRFIIQSSKKPLLKIISQPFEIFQKSLKLTQPAPNAILVLDAGSNFTIKWDPTNMEHDNLKLMFRERPNSSLVTIKESIPATSLQYEWKVFNINSDQCRILIKELDGSPIDSSAFFTIKFDDQKPVIIVDPTPFRPRQGNDLAIIATIKDANATTNALFFRNGGDIAFSDSVSMDSIGNDQFQTVIPASKGAFKLDERGLEFYIKSVDHSPSSNTVFSDTIYLSVFLDSFGFNILNSQPGKDQKYQMISIPYELDEKSIKAALEDDLGQYNPKLWRLWAWIPGLADYMELNKHDDVKDFIQGKSFWIASTKSDFFTGAGRSFLLNDFNLRLQPGWNQISNPFAFPVSYADIIAANDTSGLGPFHVFDEILGWPPVAVLEPKTGYFIKNSKQNEVVLKILPIATATPSGYLTRPNFSVNEWEMKLIINSEHVIDAYNFLGIYQTAHPEWDHFDYPEPPPAPGKYVSLYFPHQDWKKYPDNYTTDFRPAIEEGQVWDFVVASNVANSKSKIRFEGIEFIPGELEVMLIDEIFNISQDLRQNPEYSFPILSNAFSKQLKIAVGNSEYFKKIVLPEYEIPGDFELSQNFPNPFNRATVIRYGLPVSSKVTIKIFNMIGEQVIALEENNQKNAGYYITIWDAIDRNGNVVPNGLYFFQIYAEGSYTRTIKMILIK